MPASFWMRCANLERLFPSAFWMIATVSLRALTVYL